MKQKSMKFKFLVTIISAMLACAIFIGGLSIYEVDSFVQLQAREFINVTCEKETAQINNLFSDMEKSVHIMESYFMDLIESKEDIEDRDKQINKINMAEKMFIDVAKHAEGGVAFYLRLDPKISDQKAGFFYSKTSGGEEYSRFDPTDLLLYEKDDTEHVGWFWQPYESGKPVWMMPYYNQNNGIFMISYVVPLYYEGQFIGVLGMDFDYTVLLERVRKIRIYEHGFARLEFDGTVIQQNDQENTFAESGKYFEVSEKLINGMTLVLLASYDDIRQIRYDIALKILFTVLILVILFSAVVVFSVGRIVRPLIKLTDASEKLASGNYDVEIIHSDTYEIRLLSTTFEKMAIYLREHELQQRLLAYRDSMTGLRNTTAYKSWIADFEKEMKENNEEVGVIIFDINCLKEANDLYGHETGNKLIVKAAQIIASTFKRSPVFRIGGDEFVAILRNHDLAHYEKLVEKLDEICVSEFIDAGKEKIRVRIAKGFARYDRERDEQFADVFQRADEAMYKNKREMKEEKEK